MWSDLLWSAPVAWRRSSWTLQLSFCDDVTGKPIHFKADGAR
jgi:hypothetical protein